MAYLCGICLETQVTSESDTCAACAQQLKLEDAAARGPSGRTVQVWRDRKTPEPKDLLDNQGRIYLAAQGRLALQITETVKLQKPCPACGIGSSSKLDEARLQAQTLALGRQINDWADTMRKYENEDREKARKRTPAQKFEAALNYILSGKVTPEQRQEALVRVTEAQSAPLLGVERRGAKPGQGKGRPGRPRVPRAEMTAQEKIQGLAPIATPPALPEVTPEDVERARAAMEAEREALGEST